jgi:membrane-associated phospholipid phosphatase
MMVEETLAQLGTAYRPQPPSHPKRGHGMKIVALQRIVVAVAVAAAPVQSLHAQTSGSQEQVPPAQTAPEQEQAPAAQTPAGQEEAPPAQGPAAQEQAAPEQHEQVPPAQAPPEQEQNPPAQTPAQQEQASPAPTPAGQEQVPPKVTKEGAVVVPAGITCDKADFASADCVAMLEFGPIRVIRAGDIWEPLTMLALGEGAAALLRDTTNRCHWCDVDATTGVDRLGGLDSWGLNLRWGNGTGSATDVANALSWATLATSALVPAYLAGRTSEGGRFARNFAIISFAAFSADALTSVVKVISARERPYSYRLTKAGDTTSRPGSAYRSFFSGHASVAFAATVVGSRLMNLYPASIDGKKTGNRAIKKWVLWVSPVLTAYLRTAADQHFVTDVLVGAATGYLVGGYVAAHVKPGRAPGNGSSHGRSTGLELMPTMVSVGHAVAPGVSIAW